MGYVRVQMSLSFHIATFLHHQVETLSICVRLAALHDLCNSFTQQCWAVHPERVCKKATKQPQPDVGWGKRGNGILPSTMAPGRWNKLLPNEIWANFIFAYIRGEPRLAVSPASVPDFRYGCRKHWNRVTGDHQFGSFPLSSLSSLCISKVALIMTSMGRFGEP